MAKLKRSASSLVGGIAVAIGVLILWLLVAGEVTPASVTLGLVVAGAVGAWTRLADL